MVRPADHAETTTTARDATRGKERADVATASYLFAALHCDAPMSGGARFALGQLDEVVVTRGPARRATREETSDGRILTLEIPGTFVSRGHARFKRVLRDWIVVDEGSKNGVFVNQKKVTRATLADKDVVECGHTLFVFRSALAVHADAPESLEIDVANEPTWLPTLLPDLRESHAVLERIAASPLSVLLLGESGTGKEVVAQAIHARSARPGPIVAMNCGAIPAGLLESQLFGHVKGAFSGALRDESGYFRAAQGGTLFLDELGDLPLPSQVAFLRTLETGTVTPVGTTKPVPVDVRIVAATNRPLESLVANGHFRADLLARLAGFTHRLDVLRDRIEDLGILTAALLPQIAQANAADVTFSTDAGYRLLVHAWPLNVRELRSCLASALVISDGATIEGTHIDRSLTSSAASRSGSIAAASPADGIRTRLVELLTEHRGNVAAVARAFGKAPAQIRRWIEQHELDLDGFRR